MDGAMDGSLASIAFSRVAIVDIATTVFYTLSFITFYAAFTKRKTLYYVMFGICFGLSMLTKYLAFLCFAAPLLFIAFVYLVRFRDRKLKMKDVLFDLKGMFIAAVIAAVMYMPWPLYHLIARESELRRGQGFAR